MKVDVRRGWPTSMICNVRRDGRGASRDPALIG